MDYFDYCFPGEACFFRLYLVVKGAGSRVAVLLLFRYVPFNFAKYIVINGGFVELNNSDCAKCR